MPETPDHPIPRWLIPIAALTCLAMWAAALAGWYVGGRAGAVLGFVALFFGLCGFMWGYVWHATADPDWRGYWAWISVEAFADFVGFGLYAVGPSPAVPLLAIPIAIAVGGAATLKAHARWG